MMPVRPPNRKVTRNPTDQSMGVSKLIDPPHIVPIQLKNFTPVGTAIRNVIPEKKARSTAPVTNMWCAHTATERIAMPRVAPTSPTYPKIGLRLNTGRISVTMPKNGSAMM